ncbi:MAG: hypothetical protein ABSG64_09160 [Solirubrobacteraceae bacterium]
MSARPARGSRAHSRRLATLGAAVAFIALLAPASASATGSGTPLTTTLPTPTLGATTPTLGSSTPPGPVTVPAPVTTSSGGGITSVEEAAIFVVAGLVIFSIARIIVNDARRHAPAGTAPSIDRPRGSVAPLEHRLKRSRAKAKRARRARRAAR